MYRFLSVCLLLSCLLACDRKQERIVKIVTTAGTIRVKLYDETPRHRDNFMKLVRDKFYDGILFHRVINHFMIQAGDPNSKNAAAGEMLGEGDVGYTIPAEFDSLFFHKRGMLAAAREGDDVNPERRSSGSHFYIVQGKVYTQGALDSLVQKINVRRKEALYNRLYEQYEEQYNKLQQREDLKGMENLTAKLSRCCDSLFMGERLTLTEQQRKAYTTEGGIPHLDGQYTVFGEVIEGLEVLDKIAAVATDTNDRPVQDVVIRGMEEE